MLSIARVSSTVSISSRDFSDGRRYQQISTDLDVSFSEWGTRPEQEPRFRGVNWEPRDRHSSGLGVICQVDPKKASRCPRPSRLLADPPNPDALLGMVL